MRRVLGLMLLFLLAGAATTVIVSWACAFSPRTPSGVTYTWVDTSTGRTWMAYTESGWGVESLTFASYMNPGTTFNVANAQPLPQWVRGPDGDQSIRAEAVGWPWPALCAHGRAGGVGYRYDLKPALKPPVQTASGEYVQLPLAPIWPGFAASTLMWAAAWVALAIMLRGSAAGVRLLRRRSGAHIHRLEHLRCGGLDREGSLIDLPVQCPRCAYEQRGEVERWTDSCPMQGTCAECGLVFDWRDVFNPWHALPRWSVECQRSRLAFPLQCGATFVHTLMPWRFWKRIGLAHPHRWRRVTMYLIALVLLLAATGMLVNGVAAWGHWYDAVMRGGFTPSTGGWRVFAQAALLPYSEKWWGTFASPAIIPAGAGAAYDPPRYAAEMILSPSIVLTIYFLIAQACTGLAFAALPASRRRARVRAGHVARIACYAGGLIVAPVVLGMIHAGLAYASLSLGVIEGLASLASFIAWWSLPIVVVAWWALATKHYLRMPHSWGVGIAVTVIGALLPLTLIGIPYLFVPPGW